MHNPPKSQTVLLQRRWCVCVGVKQLENKFLDSDKEARTDPETNTHQECRKIFVAKSRIGCWQSELSKEERDAVTDPQPQTHREGSEEAAVRARMQYWRAEALVLSP